MKIQVVCDGVHFQHKFVFKLRRKRHAKRKSGEYDFFLHYFPRCLPLFSPVMADQYFFIYLSIFFNTSRFDGVLLPKSKK